MNKFIGIVIVIVLGAIHLSGDLIYGLCRVLFEVDCMCNELGGGRRRLDSGAGWTPARPASVDQVHTKNNRHTLL